MTAPTLAERDFIGRFGLFYEMAGQQRIAGMIVGWLMICDPPQQSITALADTLDVSKASVSTVIRQLQQIMQVERHPMPDTRQHYYRLSGGGNWAQILQNRWQFMSLGRRISQDGLALVADDPQRSERIQEYVDFLSFMEEELGEAVSTRWQEFRRKKHQERESS
jgi:DNA-binding MarR family transcriptional regulator